MYIEVCKVTVLKKFSLQIIITSAFPGSRRITQGDGIKQAAVNQWYLVNGLFCSPGLVPSFVGQWFPLPSDLALHLAGKEICQIRTILTYPDDWETDFTGSLIEFNRAQDSVGEEGCLLLSTSHCTLLRGSVFANNSKHISILIKLCHSQLGHCPQCVTSLRKIRSLSLRLIIHLSANTKIDTLQMRCKI